jgi:hypothetical protein
MMVAVDLHLVEGQTVYGRHKKRSMYSLLINILERIIVAVDLHLVVGQTEN